MLTGTSYMSILTKSVAFENGFADKSDTSIAKLSIQNYLTLGPDSIRGFSKLHPHKSEN